MDLFSPGDLGGIPVRNHFVRSATFEGLADDDGAMTDKLIRLYSRLAKGGVGLIITGNFIVSADGKTLPRTTMLDSDDSIEDLRSLVETAHERGAKIVAQLNHGGRQCDPKVLGAQPIAPSPVRYMANFVKPRAMSAEEIEATIAAFGDAARRCQTAGFDGVQIHGAHGYLVSQFLSPQTNKRNDEWGGSREKRRRFVHEVYDAMRSETGEGYPILIKLGVQDQDAGGLELEDALSLCDELADRGVAAIEVSGGNNGKGMFSIRGDVPAEAVVRGRSSIERFLFRTFFEKSMRTATQGGEGYFLPNAALVKHRVGSRTSVIAVGGIRDRLSMERALKRGHADFISLCRPLIRQPNLIRKMEADAEATSTCVSCNRCIIEVGFHYRPLKCYLNEAKREN